MAVNYMEDGTLAEPAPINAFMKSPSAIIGDGDAMVLPDMAATIFEGEAELAVVISKRASHVKATDAMSYIFGYTNFIDGSARGVVPPILRCRRISRLITGGRKPAHFRAPAAGNKEHLSSGQRRRGASLLN
jgi:2-keto-4-pentenoate hydratase/2-oxohepta-3-ene-1,7-dioic acid hydratase in catechol pathway